MKRLLSLAVMILLSSAILAQSYKVQWGEDMKIKKGSVDMEIIHADKDGVYFVEGKMRMKSYFVIGATYGTAYKLLKFDRNYSLVYEKEFKRELKDRDFHSIQYMNKNLYLFAFDYNKKEKVFTVYGIKVDMATGQASGEMKLMGSFQREMKDEAFNFAFKPTEDSTRWMLVGDISNAQHTALSISIFDKELKMLEKSDIKFGFAKNTFDLEDVILTKDNKFVVMGKEFEFVETGKKKKKSVRTFKKYSLAKYNKDGVRELEVPTEVGDNFTISGKLIAAPDGKFYLAGFYASNVKKNEIAGVFLNMLDPVTGQVIKSSTQEISGAQLSQGIDDGSDDDDEIKESKKSKQKAKEDDDEIDFGKSFVIRDVVYNPQNNGFLILSEVFKFEEYSYVEQNYNSTTKTWNSRWVTVFSYINSDMLVVNATSDGQISRINYIPKYQVESIRSYSGTTGISYGQNPNEFFAKGGGMPFYSSFTHMLYKDKLYFVFNDSERNGGVINGREKVRMISNFKKSSAFGLELDLTTGIIKRKSLFSNEDEPIVMPRFGFVSGNEMFLPAMRMKALGKTEFKMGKITIK